MVTRFVILPPPKLHHLHDFLPQVPAYDAHYDPPGEHDPHREPWQDEEEDPRAEADPPCEVSSEDGDPPDQPGQQAPVAADLMNNSVTDDVCPAFPPACIAFPCPNPIYLKQLEKVDWSTDMSSKESDKQAILQKRLIQAWRENPVLGYFPTAGTSTPKSQVVAREVVTPTFGVTNDGTQKTKKLRYVFFSFLKN